MRTWSFFAMSVLSIAGLSACIQRPPPREPLDAEARAPKVDVMSALESRLVAAPAVRIKYSIVSRGVVVSNFQGSLLVQRGNRVKLEATGMLDEKPSRPTLTSDGRAMQGGSNDKTFATETPRALGEAMLLGVTRMGLLHNLIVVSGGAPPDGSDGSIKNFASVSHVARGANEPMNGVEAERYDFKVIVRGKPMGDATLWIDPRTGAPLKRHQVTHFPDGELTVDETYEFFTLGGADGPNDVEVTPVPVEI
jgi:hypothetical protein